MHVNDVIIIILFNTDSLINDSINVGNWNEYSPYLTIETFGDLAIDSL